MKWVYSGIRVQPRYDPGVYLTQRKATDRRGTYGSLRETTAAVTGPFISLLIGNLMSWLDYTSM